MKTLIRKAATLICTAMALLTAPSAQANNIQVTNPTLINGTGGNATVQFDLSWENSWRGGGVSNWDAAWVFVKYYSGNTWHHVLLNNSGHVAASGSQIDVGLLSPGTAYNASSNPALGVFAYRSTDGNGNVAYTGMQLSWNYGAQGLAFNDITKIQVFAIEMVYAPQGAFSVGGSGLNAFTLTTIDNYLGNGPGGYPTGSAPPDVFLYPNGFKAFYCMKYEVSQQGYVDFLNTLTYMQQTARTTSTPSSPAGTQALPNAYRNGIVIQTPGVANTTPALCACNLNGNSVCGEATDGQDFACNYLSWGDLTAYLDWSGLRPMTELEFEKACRGTLPAVPDEYPWGTTGIAATHYGYINQGANDEGISLYSTELGNANYSATIPPFVGGVMRVGVFAANVNNSGRVTAGASYYGIMELGGNLWEQTVTIGNADGRAYIGTHGNGALAASGNPDGDTWPAPTTAVGAGVRGGAFNTDATNLRVSDRQFADTGINSRSYTSGGRGARLAP